MTYQAHHLKIWPSRGGAIMTKKRSNFLFLILFLITFSIYAFPTEYFDTESSQTEEDILDKKEFHLFNENLIKVQDSRTGVITRKYYSGHDKMKIYTMGHVNEEVSYAKDLLGIEAGAAFKLKWFWVHGFLSQHRSKFRTITENRSVPGNTFNPEAEENVIREGENNETLSTIGLGLGLRAKLNLSFFPTDKIFHTASAYVTYNELDESFRNRKYLGAGFKAVYGLEHRPWTSFFYGPAFSYNFAIVQRGAINNLEDSNDRRLYLSYLTLGFLLGIYF